jgi:hypothetical protein
MGKITRIDDPIRGTEASGCLVDQEYWGRVTVASETLEIGRTDLGERRSEYQARCRHGA